MALNKKQEEFAQKYFKENTECKSLYINPKGEWFTQENDAQNSLEKNEKGEIVGKVECVKSEELLKEK